MCMQTLSQTTVLCTHGSAMMHKYIYPQVRSKSDLSSSMWFCTPVQLINILTKSLKLRDYKLPAKGFGDENNIFCHRSENKCIEFKNNPLTHQPMQITQHHIDPPTHTQTSSELLRCIRKTKFSHKDATLNCYLKNQDSHSKTKMIKKCNQHDNKNIKLLKRKTSLNNVFFFRYLTDTFWGWVGGGDKH